MFSFRLHYDWSKYGHSAFLRLFVAGLVINFDTWLDDHTKGVADRDFKALEASIDVDFPGKGEWVCLQSIQKARLR